MIRNISSVIMIGSTLLTFLSCEPTSTINEEFEVSNQNAIATSLCGEFIGQNGSYAVSNCFSMSDDEKIDKCYNSFWPCSAERCRIAQPGCKNFKTLKVTREMSCHSEKWLYCGPCKCYGTP